jgi:hypothetical protein
MLIYMRLWADWLVDNPRDHARGYFLTGASCNRCLPHPPYHRQNVVRASPLAAAPPNLRRRGLVHCAECELAHEVERIHGAELDLFPPQISHEYDVSFGNDAEERWAIHCDIVVHEHFTEYGKIFSRVESLTLKRTSVRRR